MNLVDFPFKTVVVALMAAAALAAWPVYGSTLAPEQRLSRFGLSLVIGGAAGNLIDRLAADTCSTSSTSTMATGTSGRSTSPMRRFGRRGADDSRSDGTGALPCIQSCLTSDRSPSIVRSPAGACRTCSACGWRCDVRSSGASTPRASSTSASTSSSRRWLARSSCCWSSTSISFVRLRRAAVAGALGRRVLRRTDPRGRGGVLVHRNAPHAVLDDVRRVCAGIALGHVTGRMGCLAAGCCYGRRRACRGRSRSPIRSRPPMSDAVNIRCIRRSSTRRRRAADPRSAAGDGERVGRSPAARSGVHVPLRGLALHHRDLRGDPRGMVFDVFSTSQFISLILAPLSHRDARLAVAAFDPSPPCRGVAASRGVNERERSSMCPRSSNGASGSIASSCPCSASSRARKSSA
jgi:hypothetical protein